MDPLPSAVRVLSLLFLCAIGSGAAWAAAPDSSLAARAVNSLGLRLLARTGAAPANALISPYSIQNALAMTWTGADGATWREMGRVLDFGTNESALHASFSALGSSLDQLRQRTETLAAEGQKHGQPFDPVSLVVANRLFGEESFAFRPDFIERTRVHYGAALEPLDFLGHADAARLTINRWVSGQTRDRIQDLIPPDALSPDTRLILVNAIYMKAPWQVPFEPALTRPERFHVTDATPQMTPTMTARKHFGYRRDKGFSAITLPYLGDDLQFLILLPDALTGLAAVERSLTPQVLADCARLPRAELELHLPKLHLQPPVMNLGKTLKGLGMTTAFDEPPGSANFGRMAPKGPGADLKISEVFHKTFLDLDEQGTEAAAATAVAMAPTAAPVTPKPKPILVRVDHPFLFAVQHRTSGACLFIGRLVNPR